MTTPFNAPVISGMTMTAESVAWARCRPPAARARLPEVGERVLYRAMAHGPTMGAEVTAVDMDNRQDLNVWRFVVDPQDPSRGPRRNASGDYVMELVDDPWPDATLRIDGVSGLHVCREARLAGSPGWLHAVEEK